MSEEQDIQLQVVAAFGFLADRVRVQRARRIWAEAPADRVAEVFEWLVTKANFTMLCTITGLDNGATLGAIYHLARESGVVFSLSVNVPKEKPVLRTVTGRFPAADCYEREMIDLLGMQVEGLPPGNRYPLPDGWPEGQHPLRKEWKTAMLDPKAPPGEGPNA